MIRIVWIIIVIVVLVGFFSNPWSQAQMDQALESLQFSFGIVANAGEIEEIRIAVNEFMELRKIRHTPEAQEKASKLDERLNNLKLVNENCKQNISTLELAFAGNPYNKLQENCSVLSGVSSLKAAQLWSRVG
jgi:hypothetical protein